MARVFQQTASALARAYLYSDLSIEDRLAAEAAMIVLLDDSSPLVRKALAEALSGADDAPHGIILALSQDQPEIAAIVASRSPVLGEADLVLRKWGAQPLVSFSSKICQRRRP
jgi:uncharacterized protein (DUF2336 family)